jgi:hypothetical protein
MPSNSISLFSVKIQIMIVASVLLSVIIIILFGCLCFIKSHKKRCEKPFCILKCGNVKRNPIYTKEMDEIPYKNTIESQFY